MFTCTSLMVESDSTGRAAPSNNGYESIGMKLTFKSLQGSNFSLDAEPTDTVSVLDGNLVRPNWKRNLY